MSEAAQTPAAGTLLEQEYAIPPRQRFNPLRWAMREPAGAFSVVIILIVGFMAGGASLLNTTNPQTLDAFTADVLSTALYVMGPDAGLAWASARGFAACFIVPAAGSRDVTFRTTPAFDQRFPL